MKEDEMCMCGHFRSDHVKFEDGYENCSKRKCDCEGFIKDDEQDHE